MLHFINNKVDKKHHKKEERKIKRYFFDISLKAGLGKPAICLYLTGCDNPNKCKGCHNPELQEKDKFSSVTVNEIKLEMEEMINNFKEIYPEVIVCFIGGEPLADYNRNILLGVSEHSKKLGATNIIYTWRKLQNIENEKLKDYIKYIDYGVLGVFDINKEVKHQIPSSSNQCIFNFKDSSVMEPVKLRI